MKLKVATRKKIDGPDSPQIIGGRLREARELAGLSGPQLATLLGVSRQGLNQMELGRSGTSVSVLERLARILQTTPEWLRYGIGNGPGFPRPVMVPEINVESIGFTVSTLMEHRTNREWAMPLSEAQRLGVTEHKLIAIRVNEALAPEFKAGDVVVVDLGATKFTRPGYYALNIDDHCRLGLLLKPGGKILGTVVSTCFRGLNNFLLPTPK
jgi:transcriptional regulator with XRE-family HTH domain